MKKSDFLDYLAHLISMLGSWWGISLLGFILCCLNIFDGIDLFYFLGWVFIPTILSELVKLFIKRKRPVMRGEKVKVKTYNYSFPSSHVVASVMLVSYMITDFNLWWLFFWVLLVAWSRVRLKAHDLIDVIGGAVFGLIFVLIL